MLGDDDHGAVDNEPVNPEDLFGDDLFGDNENEQPNENEANDENNVDGGPSTEVPTTATKKHRVMNRLPNLNDVWLTDSRRESIRKVNGYFDKIKFRKGKGQERENLKILLQRYEYFGQNCYPKLCFKDFVEKVETVSGKRSIKHVLQDIRHGRELDLESDNDDENEAMNTEEPGSSAPDQAPQPDLPSREPSPTPQADEPTPPPKQMTNEMRDFIRCKREEALAKRKQKLDESVNQSSSNREEVNEAREGSLNKTDGAGNDGKEKEEGDNDASKDSSESNSGQENNSEEETNDTEDNLEELLPSITANRDAENMNPLNYENVNNKNIANNSKESVSKGNKDTSDEHENEDEGKEKNKEHIENDILENSDKDKERKDNRGNVEGNVKDDAVKEKPNSKTDEIDMDSFDEMDVDDFL